MSGRPTLGAAIIAKDEQRKLPGLLALLNGLDEVLLVDGGSRDFTADVARRHGCRVYHRAFDNFAAQRNFALDLMRTQWVLSIDADERPTPALMDEIRRRLCANPPAAFRVPIRSTIFGRRLRRSGTQDDCPVRLTRSGHARWVGNVHERLVVRGPVRRLRHWVEHETIPDLETFVSKVRRYTALEAQARVAAGRAPSWRQAVLAPPREIFRRLVWKQGLLDGPAGWAFSVLSGWSEWVLAGQHRRLWQLAESEPAGVPAK